MVRNLPFRPKVSRAPLPRPQPYPTQRPVNPRKCAICEDDDFYSKQFIRPCGKCSKTYCSHCLVDAFNLAAAKPASMPATCCTILPFHTVVQHMTANDAEDYLEAFDDWVTARPTKPEPGEPDSVSACHHEFIVYRPYSPPTNINRGDMNRMECTHCYDKVVLAGRSPRLRLWNPQPLPANDSKKAWHCMKCHLFTCYPCAEKYREKVKEVIKEEEVKVEVKEELVEDLKQEVKEEVKEEDDEY